MKFLKIYVKVKYNICSMENVKIFKCPIVYFLR